MQNVGVAQDVVEEGVAQEGENLLSCETDGYQVFQLNSVDRFYS